jgi:hypothetical protein
LLAVNIGNEQILAFCAVATLALGISLAVNSRLKDRGDRQERARDEDEAEDERYRLLREFIISQINTVRVDLDNLTVALFGRPQDPARGIPGVEGFTQRQEHHNHLVDEELRTVNGGGTLKGALSKLQTDFGTLQHSVTALESSTVRIGTQLHDLTEEVAAQGRDSSP